MADITGNLQGNVSGALTGSMAAGGGLGKPATYNGETVAGAGLMGIVASGRVLAQTGAATLTTFAVPGGADGSFEVSAGLNVTVATSHSFNVRCLYTDETNTARTALFPVVPLTGLATTNVANAAGAVPWWTVLMRVRAKAGTTITVDTFGAFTTVTYNGEATVKRLA